MNYLGVHQTPDLLEEVWRELGRERRLERRSRSVGFGTRVRRALRRDPG